MQSPPWFTITVGNDANIDYVDLECLDVALPEKLDEAGWAGVRVTNVDRPEDAPRDAACSWCDVEVRR